jgi:hypothetical protein
MSANTFTIEGNDIESFDDFINNEIDGTFSNLIYYPDVFYDDRVKSYPLRNKAFMCVSFRNTTFVNVRFINCIFESCLFMSAHFEMCEFINCTFKKCNTSKAKFNDTLIDPDYFSENFSLIDDTNIAADLYHSLYKNLASERQPERALDSLYLMFRAEYAHLPSQLKRGKIRKGLYYKKKLWHLYHYNTSGYGLKKY